MCIGKGMIVRRFQEEPDYLMDSNDHAPLVEVLGLKDNKLVDRNFVRIELWPTDELTSTNPDDWDFKVDEEGTLPSWFEEKQDYWQEKCLTVLVSSIIPQWVKKGVGDSLYLEGTQIKSLGQLKSVGDSLYLRGTQIKSLGQLKSVGGSLYLRGTQIKSLGQLKSVGGWLNLEGTQIKSLGQLKSVGGWLNLEGTQIKSLPKSLKVDGNIYKVS